MKDKFLEFREAKIFYRVQGTGKAVILIHGFGEDGKVWNYVASRLKNTFRVIIPDLPGSGGSGIIEEPNMQMDDYAEVMLQIFKAESLDKCTVIGHSMGGYITLAIAEKYPEVLDGFGLFNSTAFADPEEKKADRRKSIDFLQKNDAASFLRTSVPGLFGDDFKQQHPGEVNAFIDSLGYFTSEALIQYLRAMMSRPDRTHVLKDTQLPVLFIVGEKDTVVPLEKALSQSHLSSITHVHILPEAGHMGMLEEKEASAQNILSYLNNLMLN